MTDTQRLVLVKGIGGLGNRMLSVLTASLFAVAAKRRLLVDWRDPIFTGRSGNAPNLFPDLFSSPLMEPLPDTIASQSVAPELWRSRLNDTVADVGRDHDPKFFAKFESFRRLGISLRRLEYPEDLLVFWSWREVVRPLRPYLPRIDNQFRNLSQIGVLREAARRYLQPNERVNAILDQFVRDHFQKRMLGLHIRATDIQSPVEKLIRLAQKIVRRENCDGVFCSTDNADVEERVRKILPNVVMTPKELPKGSVPLHYDPDCQNRTERATQALVDMLLLARCQSLVYASRSSFGYVASIYAADGQVVVDVDRFNPKVQAKRIIQSWIY
jgi:hypothetical protein